MKPQSLPAGRALILTVSTAFLFATPAFAAEKKKAEGKEQAEGKAGDSKISPMEQKFMMAAAQGGMYEVKLGEVAKDKATKPEVKEFGAMMAGDHSKANADLMEVATKKGVTIPPELDAKHQAMIDKMSKLEGAAFDKAYVDDMVKDHKHDVAEFGEASKMAKDPEVKGFIDKTLPTLKAHLEKITTIAGEKTKKK